MQIFLESTASFSLVNAEAMADTAYDVFDGNVGAVKPVIGVTYTYTSVPEPTSLLLVVSALALVGGVFRR